ncbi:MAG: alpha-L-glutamate ligase [Spirulina sp. SIO3F2]|nr:alpha-L-glutamate ligase [Spirulina sp. SIO3F2]
MLNNIRLLIAACDHQNIAYDILHPTQNLVRIRAEQDYFFVNYTVPLLSQAVAKILIDKDYTYRLLKDSIRSPETLAFFTPFCEEKYKDYLEYGAIADIVQKIQTHFTLPVIIKKNRGSSGINVFLCHNPAEITQALENIFEHDSRHYDYVALAQEYISIKHEYRAIFLNKKLVLLYEKDNQNATFSGNLSPLHWDGAKAVQITDESLMQRIQHFVEPVFEALNIPYGGFDVVRDHNDQLWFIEVNSHPNYSIFVRDNGDEPVIRVFEQVLEMLINPSSTQ